MEGFDLWGAFTSIFQTVAPLVPTNILSVIGGAAVIAAGVAKEDSQVKTKAGFIVNKLINLAAFNFGKAKNK